MNFTLPVFFGLDKPLKNVDAVKKTEAFLLHVVNVTAVLSN